MKKNRSELSPTIFGKVTANQAFTYGGNTYLARGLMASGDGAIDIIMADGTAMTGKLVQRGLNRFCCQKVTGLGGLTLEWFA